MIKPFELCVGKIVESIYTRALGGDVVVVGIVFADKSGISITSNSRGPAVVGSFYATMGEGVPVADGGYPGFLDGE